MNIESNSPTNQSLNEPSCVEETCRLRSGLNVNCLLEVFSYLETCDLFHLCKVDKFFKELIIERTIKNTMLDLHILQPKEGEWADVGRYKKFVEILETHLVNQCKNSKKNLTAYRICLN